MIVRRGNWIAADAVTQIERRERSWVVTMGSRTLRVAPSCVPALRAKGWI